MGHVHDNPFDVPHREGFLEIEDYDLYHRTFGTGETLLLGLHGGPGGNSESIAPLAHLGGEDRRVVLYDQFGCGRSDRPADGDFDRYTVAHYRAEVEAVRAALDADEMVLYGHSWGGMLALEYVLAHPERVSKLVLSGTLADTAEAIDVMRDARDEVLTDEELARLREFEARREFGDPEYRDLVEKVYDERVVRVEDPIWREKADLNTDAYGLMWGPTEFSLAETARLRGWSVADRLEEIAVPTLVLVGEHDEIGPPVAETIADGIPDSELRVLAGASHHSHWEVPERHREVVEDFLAG